MKYILLTFYISISTTNIFLFSSIEQWLIQSDFSWTISKITPYLLLIISGILIARWVSKFFFFKIISNRLKFLKPFIFVTITAIPFVIGFALHPIYEGDFSKQGTTIEKFQPIKDFKDVDLAVIAIPGCDYCYHSIAKLRQIKSRNPKMKIKFILCSSSFAELKDYIAEGGNTVKVTTTRNIESLQNLVEGKFPTFIMLKNDKAVYRWSNDQFGCMAIDHLESELSK